MSTIIRFGIDLAKRSFAVCGVDRHGKVQERKTLKREQLLTYFSNVPAAMVAMESGSGAHHWARQLISLGHDARIIDPRFVAPYRTQGRHGKNDINDAVAICEAAGRPHMRFVPIKHPDQQAMLVIHRLRAGAVSSHTQMINRMRGILSEFGVVLPKGAWKFKTRWRELRGDPPELIPLLVLDALDVLYEELGHLHTKVLGYDQQIRAHVRTDDRASRLMQLAGIGSLTASAIVATVGQGRDFCNGRQFAAWIGLTPRQYSTGGQARLGRITKRGDKYLRTLLVHGARSALMRMDGRDDRVSRWARSMLATKSWNKVAVALANKHARMAWGLLNQPN